ncbi:hypothetical protein BJY01DRAFT_257013 [Aspergillus pseudoustus]|uniref:Zn(2)-C6 fungal-type domain-containing protein n=1 Tax=Aspergillus pseudoustus TaxID=1810923 RepID=A0ABR4JNJ3_9EURO
MSTDGFAVSKKSSRKRPVSCHFCRSRKLRCSRRFPCPNCTSRGIPCELYASQPAEIHFEENSNKAPGSITADILARLQTLENIVLHKDKHISTPESDLTPDSLLAQSRSIWGEQNATEDARWLQLECSIQSMSSAVKPDEAEFRECPIRQIKVGVSVTVQGSLTAPSEDVTKTFWVPLYQESRCLVEKYVEDLTYLVHVIHIPSVRAMVDHLYRDIHMQKRPNSSHVALLSSIIANTLYSWTRRDSEKWISLPVEDANRGAFTWLKSTLDLLDYASQMSGDTLEGTQARIIVSSLMCNLEGVSPRYRSLLLTAITSARELGLHKIDYHGDLAIKDIQSSGTVEAEIGRRVWWYLAATDWVLSQWEGPLKGTYTVSPRHMLVKKPSNIDDTDLTDITPTVERPMEYPTYVSYTLQRIRLGELCRELTDNTSIFGSEKLNYDVVLEYDKKTNDYIGGFPGFFQLEGGSSKDIEYLNPNVTPGVLTQRYILNTLAYAHRCRLHLPYFARGSVNPSYIYSRQICLEAARAVIGAERIFEKESTSFVRTRFRFAGSMHCLSVAIIVFVLDVCLYKDERQEEERKKEAADACAILQKAKNDSSIAARLLQSFMRVIRKHKVTINGMNNASKDDDINATLDHSFPTMGAVGSSDSPSYGLPVSATEQSLLNPQSSYWTGFRETFDNGTESIDWNALFFDLDAQGLDGGALF